jgi:carbonic anhydrase
LRKEAARVVASDKVLPEGAEGEKVVASACRRELEGFFRRYAMMNRMRGGFAVLAAVALMAAGRGARGEAAPAMPTPEQAIYKLVDGHARYLMGAPTNPRRNEKRRAEVAAGQHPFAAVLSCADSRVPVEVLFDQGLGDIFSVRVAGNVADVSEMASLEYGVEHLQIPVVVVLGHTKCGAVSAAISGGELPPHLAHLLGLIAPAVTQGRKIAPALSGNDRVTDVVRRNVVMTMGTLLTDSPIIREAVESKKLKLVGAVYDLDDGKVRFMGEHPEQAGILAAAAKEGHGGTAAHAPASTAAAPSVAHADTTAVEAGEKAVPTGGAAAPGHANSKPTISPVAEGSGHGASANAASAHH